MGINLFANKKIIPPILGIAAMGIMLLVLFGERIIPRENSKFTFFVDVFDAAGLTRHPHSSGVAWYDYDRDGNLDLLIAGATPQMYRNGGDATFTNVIEKIGIKVPFRLGIFGDYDNDGCGDIFTAGRTHGYRLSHNNCNGTFTDVTEASGITREAPYPWWPAAAWADYDNDGYLDLYVVSAGIFSPQPDPRYYSFDSNVLYRNNGNGTFSDVTERAGVNGVSHCGVLPVMPPQVEKVITGPLKQSLQPIWFDYDNDGDVDLFVATDLNVSPLYRNNGNGTFSEVTEESGLCRSGTNMGVTIGDYDGDGDFDLYVTNAGANYFWHNRNGIFSETAAETGTADHTSFGWGTEFFDYDNDGDLDLYVANGAFAPQFKPNPNTTSWRDKLFENDGTYKFVDVGTARGITGDDLKEAAAFGDFDRNGFIDVVVMSPWHSSDPQGRLYQNRGNGNNWISLQLVGVRSNRDGVGAKISVQTGKRNQTRQVTSGGSYISQSSLWQTFGLAAYPKADRITIRWPSGTVQTLQNVRADQKIIVTEE